MNDEGHKGLLEDFQGFGVGSPIDLGEKLRQEQVFREDGVVSALGNRHKFRNISGFKTSE